MIKETESRALNISKENLIKLGKPWSCFPALNLVQRLTTTPKPKA